MNEPTPSPLSTPTDDRTRILAPVTTDETQVLRPVATTDTRASQPRTTVDRTQVIELPSRDANHDRIPGPRRSVGDDDGRVVVHVHGTVYQSRHATRTDDRVTRRFAAVTPRRDLAQEVRTTKRLAYVCLALVVGLWLLVFALLSGA